MRGSLDLTFRVRMVEVEPGQWAAVSVRVEPRVSEEVACDVALALAHELELRRVQRTNDPQRYIEQGQRPDDGRQLIHRPLRRLE